MIQTGENQTNGRETCASNTLSITKPTWIGLESNANLRQDKHSDDSVSWVCLLYEWISIVFRTAV